MLDKRKAKRLPISLALEISTIYKQNDAIIEDINAPIEIINISKYGIGFQTKSNFPTGYYFNANINLGGTDTLNSVVKIIRKEEKEDNTYYYGCEFIAIADILSYIVDEYEESL